MSDLAELFRATDADDTQLPRIVSAIIAEDASSTSDQVHVIIPAHDEHQKFGPCKWMPRGTDLPAEGDSAVVIFDEQDDPWIAVWWP